MRHTLLACVAAACVAPSLGCAGPAFTDLADGPRLDEGAFSPNGVVGFVTAKGAATYAAVGEGLLTAWLDGGLVAALPLQPATAVGLRPASLEVRLATESDGVELAIGFHPFTVPLLSGCPRLLRVQSLAATIVLHATTDADGRIRLSPAAISVQREMIVEPADGCAALDPVVQADLGHALELPLREELPAAAATLAEALLGARLAARLDVPVTDPTRFGRLTLELVGAGTGPAMLATGGALVAPLRVGVGWKASGCAGDGPGPAAKPSAAPVPALPAALAERDVAVAVRLEVLRRALSGVLASGLACQRGASAPAITVADVADLLPELLAAGLAPALPIRLRLRVDGEPTLTRTEGTEALDIHLPSVAVDVFVERWGGDWWVAGRSGSVTLSGAVPTLDASWHGQTIRLTGGTVAGAADPTTGGLLALALDRVTDGLAVLAIPAAWPYPLTGPVVRVTDEHVFLGADLRTDAAPALSRRVGPLRAASAPGAAGTGCTAGPSGHPGPTAGVWLLLLCVLAARRRRAA